MGAQVAPRDGMDPSTELRDETGRDRRELRRRSMQQIAALVLAFGAVDALTVGYIPWGAFAVRAAWALVLVGIAAVEPRTEEGLACASRMVSWVSIPAMAAVVHLSGGVNSVLIIAFPALPLISVLFTDPRAAGLTTVLSVIAVFTLMALDGAPWMTTLAWSVLVVLMGTLAVLGGKHLLRTQALRVEAERQRAEAERAKAEALGRVAASERRAAHAERLALVGSLASGVAHEINNPLAFAKSSALYLHERLGPEGDEDTRLAFEDVTVGLARIEQIVRDLRNFSREDREGTATVAVEALVAEAVRIASVRLHGAVKVEVDVADAPPAFETSPGRVVQVLVNLLVNAADALETANPRPDPARLWVRARQDAGWLELSVEDNGPGIPSEVLPRLFQPFFTTKPAGKGTGLGLAVSLEYSIRLGGTLRAENRTGGGARFTLRLPTAESQSCREVTHMQRAAAA